MDHSVKLTVWAALACIIGVVVISPIVIIGLFIMAFVNILSSILCFDPRTEPEFIHNEDPDLDDEDQYDRILHQTLNERGIVEDDYEWRE